MQEIVLQVVRRLLPAVGFVGGVFAAVFAIGLIVGAVRGVGTAVARLV